MGVGEGKEKMKRAALQMTRERESQVDKAQRTLVQEDLGSITDRHHFAHACKTTRKEVLRLPKVRSKAIRGL
jgi:hypothetical protein